jgi:hypothetical protein
MASDPPSPGFRLFWVPIVVALLAAAIVTLRGCTPERPAATEAREGGRR